MLAPVHTCQTAQDVRTAAVCVSAFRKAAYAKPAASAPTVAPPPLAPTVKQMPAQLSTTRRLVKAIMAESARRYGVSTDDILGRCRLLNHARARQVAMYLIRTSTPLSLPRIGTILHRDHTTVLHAVRVVEASAKLQKVAAEIAAAAQASLADERGATDAQ